jgi:cytosine/adenosine deaminase-related metal-dependent hydrolase
VSGVASYRATWVLPITEPPLRNGWVAVENGVITGIGRVGAPGTPGTLGTRGTTTDLGNVAVLPALVNAHTHLELSYLAGVVPPAAQFLDWIRAVMAARRGYPDARDPVIVSAARTAVAAARASGTGLVGDISNTLVTVPLLQEAGMCAHVFYELLGFNADDPAGRVRTARDAIDGLREPHGDIRLSLAPHAPYSVSPALFGALRRDLDAHPDGVSTVHLSESGDEVEFIASGSGGWRELLAGLNVWSSAWQPPGLSPVAYLADLGFLDRRVLAVHAVQCGDDDLERLRALGTTVVSCPRSNRYVGVGDPPLDKFYAAGVDVAFGTDSLASVADLNMFAELAVARRLAPRVAARLLLESATLCGARALGFGGMFGSIEPGKRAALVAVRLPAHVDDVEEYLVSGVQPGDITWLNATRIAQGQ